jgi:hypothetical protein
LKRKFALVTFITGSAILGICHAGDLLTFSDLRIGQDEATVLPALRNSARVEEKHIPSEDAAAVQEAVGDMKSFTVSDPRSGKMLGEITFIRGKLFVITRQVSSLLGQDADFVKELYSVSRPHTDPSTGPNKPVSEMSAADLLAFVSTRFWGERTGTAKVTLTDPSGVGDDLKMCFDWTAVRRVCLSFMHSKDYGDLATLVEIESWDVANVPVPIRAQ